MGYIDAKRYIPGSHTEWTPENLLRVRQLVYDNRKSQEAWKEYGPLVELLRQGKLGEATILVGEGRPDLASVCEYIPVDYYAHSVPVLLWLRVHSERLFWVNWIVSHKKRWFQSVADAIVRGDREYVRVLAEMIEEATEVELVAYSLIHMVESEHQGSAHPKRTVETLLRYWSDLKLAQSIAYHLLHHIAQYLDGEPCHSLWIELSQEWPLEDLCRIVVPFRYYQGALTWILQRDSHSSPMNGEEKITCDTETADV